MPALTSVPPAYRLSRSSTSVPSPVLVNAPAPPTWPCHCRVWPPVTESAPCPAPTTISRPLENPAETARAPPSSVTALCPEPRLASRDTCRVPAWIVVPPSWWLSLTSTSLPSPFLCRLPVPPMAPSHPSVVPAAVSMAALPVRVAACVAVKLAVVASAAFSSASAPGPRLVARDTCSVPALTSVPPACWLSPASTSVPAPSLTSVPAPATVPRQSSVAAAAACTAPRPVNSRRREVANVPVVASRLSCRCTAPWPRLASADTCSVPASTRVSPW
ncbi:Uncharacterised protein [Bordetella pertussis]|nr:Uncharacterised protein [Bordetella pertussis]